MKILPIHKIGKTTIGIKQPKFQEQCHEKIKTPNPNILSHVDTGVIYHGIDRFFQRRLPNQSVFSCLYLNLATYLIIYVLLFLKKMGSCLQIQ